MNGVQLYYFYLILFLVIWIYDRSMCFDVEWFSKNLAIVVDYDPFLFCLTLDIYCLEIRKIQSDIVGAKNAFDSDNTLVESDFSSDFEDDSEDASDTDLNLYKASLLQKILNKPLLLTP